MREVVRYANCFVCGDKNEQGLNARFFFDGRQAVTEIVADHQFEGYRGIFHGGIVASVLDEVMIKAILAGDVFAVTAEMTVRYLAPVTVGEKVRFSGWITEQRGRLYLTEGRAETGAGSLVATATGKYLEARPELRERLAHSLDSSD